MKSQSLKYIESVIKTNGEDSFFYNYLGTLDVQKDKYLTYTCFKKIKTATSYKGKSLLLFISNKDTVFYDCEDIEYFPTFVSNKYIYFDRDSLTFDTFPNPICMRSCFGKDDDFHNMSILYP